MEAIRTELNQAFELLRQRDWPGTLEILEEAPTAEMGKMHFSYPHERLVICTAGVAEYWIRRGGDYYKLKLQTGQGVFIQKGALFRSRNLESYETCGLLLRDLSIDVFINDQEHTHRHRQMLTLRQGRSDLKELFKELQRCQFSRKRYYAMMIIDETCQLLEQSQSTGGAYGRFLQLRAYVEKHYAFKVNRKDMAVSFSLNADYINSLFHRFADRSFSSYLADLRLEKAVELLLESELPVAEISLLCGYYHASYMSRCFKKQFNMTPLQYRRKYREIGQSLFFLKQLLKPM